MDYGKAEGIRKRGLVGLITDNLVGGQGIGSSFGSAISDRTKATFTGIQEKFDPLNIAKTLTGGSKLAPALLGRLTGRKQSSIEYFAGKKRPSTRGVNFETGVGIEEGGETTEVLGMIYEELKLAEEDRKLINQTKTEQESEKEKQEDKRNQAIIEAITARRKPEETPKEKAKKKKKETEKPAEPTKPEPVPAKEAPKPPAKPVEKPTAAPAPKPKVKPPTAAPKPEVKPPTAAPAPTVKPPTAAKIPPVVVSGTKGLVLSALVSAGYSKQAQANIMANVEKESNFKPRSEELGKYSAKTLYKLYGPPGSPDGQPAGGKNKVRFQTMDEAQAVVSKGPEAVGDVIYGGRMGNDKPGDGFKYRGRGFIQITGKENYDKIGKIIGVDLVNNPDLANDIEIAAKIIPAYFKLKIKKSEDLESIDKVNQAVGSASEQSKEDRKKLAVAYSNELNTGNQINAASTENKDLKRTTTDKPAPIVNNTTNINQTNTTSPKRKEKEDDRPAILEKSRG